MVFCFFLYIFAIKITTLIQILQEIMATIDNVNPQDYYCSLTKSEKSQFLAYLYNTYDMKINTTIRKLRGNYNGPIRQLERDAIMEAINTEAWRN